MKIQGVIIIIQILYSALTISDEAFYKGQDIKDYILDSLSDIQVPYCILATGPKEFNTKKNKKYPLFVAWKTNTRDNDVFIPEKYGNILISSISTGELFIRQLIYYPHKIPLPAGEDTISPLPPGYEDDEDAITTHYNYEWRDLKTGIDLPNYNGMASISILCGNYISNNHNFNITASDTNGTDNDYSKQIIKKAQAIPDNDKYYFTKTKYSPSIPKEPGITVKPPQNSIVEAGKPFIIYASFNLLPNNTQDEQSAIPIHILISCAEHKQPLHHEVIIPADMISKDEKRIKGYFMVDLMKEFFYKDGARFDIPKEIYLFAVHKDIFTDPLKISFSHLNNNK